MALEEIRKELVRQLEATDTVRVATLWGATDSETHADEQPVLYTQSDLNGNTLAWVNDEIGEINPATRQFHHEAITEVRRIKYAITKLLSQIE